MGGTAPFYDNIRWGGPDGLRVPQELAPATFLVQQDGGALAPVTLTSSLATQPTLNLTDSELTLGYQGSTTLSGSAKAIRGNTTVLAGTTIAAGYPYGSQGKLTFKGVMAGSAWAFGIVGQLDVSTATLTSGSHIAPIWGDFGATGPTATVAFANLLTLTNTTATTLGSAVYIYSKASVAFDLSANGSAMLDASSTASGSVIGHIKVLIDGVAGVLRVYTGS